MGLRLTASRKRLVGWIAVAVALVLVYVRIRYAAYFANRNYLGSDYPKTNPRPNQIVEVKVSLPRTFKLQLLADYATYPFDCMRTRYNTFPPHQEDLRIAEEVKLRGAEQQKSAFVTLDKYLPGRCDWYFSDIRYLLRDGVEAPDDRQQMLQNWVAESMKAVARSMTVGWEPKPGELREGRVDLWCTRHIPGFESPPKVICTNWAQAVGRRAPPLDPVPNVPDSQKAAGSFITFILPSTKVVEIYFHDLDAS